jgi:hypothetical protein
MRPKFQKNAHIRRLFAPYSRLVGGDFDGDSTVDTNDNRNVRPHRPLGVYHSTASETFLQTLTAHGMTCGQNKKIEDNNTTIGHRGQCTMTPFVKLSKEHRWSRAEVGCTLF